MLTVAGELFLRGLDFDIRRATSLEVPLTSGKIDFITGRTLTELPPYQWNYSKQLWAESRISNEHRAPRHERHDLLGRRVPGDTLLNPTWRNVLRIKDVPWLQHHSLGGEAVFPAAGYFSMAIEAISQLNKDSSKPLDIESYVLRDINIKTALVTPDDDDGVEVLFSMRPSMYTNDTGISWWDFATTSVSNKTEWKEHIVGTIGINAAPKKVTPRLLPNLPQRATGKNWNQGLRKVGFDYGSSFQDMEDIQFDGRHYHAACRTNIKQISGLIVDESKHVIHPSTVDSCLQLIIVSIYAGKLKEMTSSAVPLQAEEVVVLRPTMEQLKNPIANAFSWTDERGLRSFRSGSQLVGSDGQVMMYITNMRSVAYEAAVPQQIEEPIESQPFSELVWRHDIDTLSSEFMPKSLSITSLVDLFIHKDPDLDILEIGSGEIAQKVLPNWKYLSYTVSTSPDDQEVLSRLQIFKGFHEEDLDLTSSPEEQGAVDKTYDLVIALKSENTSEILKRLRTLLKPGGTIICSQLDEKLLLQASFSVPKLQTKNFVTASAIDVDGEVSTTTVARDFVLLCSEEKTPLLEQVRNRLDSCGWQVRIDPLVGCQITPDDHVILMTEIERPLLATLTSQELSALQHVLSTTSCALWITSGGLIDGKKPEHAMSAGLSRSITSENANLDLMSLDIDFESTSIPRAADNVIQCMRMQMDKQDRRESEYCVKDGTLFASRLLPTTSINEMYTLGTKESEAVPWDPSMSLVGKARHGEIVFEFNQKASELRVGQVRVHVQLVGLNQEDITIIGGTDYPTSFGYEIFGEVVEIGPGVTNLSLGSKVLGFNAGRFGTFQTASADLLQEVHLSESPENLITLPMAYVSVIHGLAKLASVSRNNRVLIVSSTDTKGAAAIHVAQMHGADVYVLVDSDEEAELVSSKFSITSQHILHSSCPSITDRIETLLDGQRMDVIFSAGSVRPSIAHELWRGISAFGQFVDVGRKNVLKRYILDGMPVQRGASYHSFDLLELLRERPYDVSTALKEALSLFREGKLPPLGIGRRSHIVDINEAISTFSDTITAGKAILSYANITRSVNMRPRAPPFHLRSDATYLLVGALGGLGRSLGSYMIANGARHFAFLSRSGTESSQAAILVRNMEQAGADVRVIKGDVTMKVDVEKALRSIPAGFPLAGVVHAAMVLRVSLAAHQTNKQTKQPTNVS